MNPRPGPRLLPALAAAVMLAASAAPAAPTAEERAAILAPATDFSAPERWETLSGGSATTRGRLDRDAFSMPSANLSFARRAEFFIGNGLFRRAWVAAPASAASADGLGPLYNARSCQRCHLKDGRGHPPAGPRDSAVSMLLRLSVPPGGGGRGGAFSRLPPRRTPYMGASCRTSPCPAIAPRAASGSTTARFASPSPAAAQASAPPHTGSSTPDTARSIRAPRSPEPRAPPPTRLRQAQPP